MKFLENMLVNIGLGQLFLLTLYVWGVACNTQGINYVKDPAFANMMCPVDQMEFQRVTRSAVSCVKSCTEALGCISLIYLNDNKTCFGIKNYNPFGTSSPLPGAVFYKPSTSVTSTSTPPVTTTTPTTTTKLLSSSTTTTTTTIITTTAAQPTTTLGPGIPWVVSLPDNKFTASSVSGACCQPWGARIDNTGYPWHPGNEDTSQWLQVDFVDQILATHVETKGCPYIGEWVTSYKVLTSTDCATFITIKDDLNNDKVFQGNTDTDTAVRNALEPPVACRCFRINPWTWTGIGLRMEVLGHEIP